MRLSIFKISIITISAIALTALALFLINQRYRTTIVEIPEFNHQLQATASSPASQVAKEKDNLGPDPTPSTLLLKVPFTPQAPTANWDELHNEACEEAVALMVNEYFSTFVPSSPGEGRIQERSNPAQSGSITLEPEYVENEITKLTKWQQENFGYYLDTTAAETAQMIEEVYGLKTRLVENFSADDLKNELVQNHLVIIPAFGRALGNPYYKSPGPIYHMLVIKGYNSAGFITNDPGTKRGLNYFYDFETLYNATADWSHEKGTVDETKKIAIIVWK